VHPILFTVPGLAWEVQSYGFFLGLALVLGWIVSMRLAEHDRLPTQPLGTAYVASVAAGILAARASFLVWHPDHVEGWHSFLVLQAGGLQLGGGAVVAVLVSWILVGRRRVGVPLLAWLDCVAPAVAIGIGLERVGALLAGADHGRYVGADFPLSITYPKGSVVFALHRSEMNALMPSTASESLAVHPTQLYAAAVALVVLVAAHWLRRRRRFSGQVFILTVTLLSIGLALFEAPLRADAGPGVVGPVSSSQLVFFGVAAILLGVYRARRARAVRDPGALRHWQGGPWTPTA
jgi:phosphatidylglycerol:prolipoprotein diacylglycerol transferase